MRNNRRVRINCCIRALEGGLSRSLVNTSGSFGMAAFALCMLLKADNTTYYSSHEFNFFTLKSRFTAAVTVESSDLVKGTNDP